MTALRFIVAAIVFIALTLLALANTEPVTLRLFNVASTDSPLAFVVFVAFACGVGTGLVAGAARSARLNRQLMRMRNERRAAREPGPHGAGPVSYTPSQPPADAL